MMILVSYQINRIQINKIEPELQDEMLSDMGSKMKLKRGQLTCIQYSLDGADDVVTAKLLGRAGKSTGKYKNSYNVEYKASKNLEGTNAYTVQAIRNITNFSCKKFIRIRANSDEFRT